MKSNIIIFGFSGSGKSSLCRRLGTALGMNIVHPSSIFKQLLLGEKPDIKSSQAGIDFWESIKGKELFKNRDQGESAIDFTCDEVLLEILSQGNTVMDSWSMPWFYHDDTVIKIYLRARYVTRLFRVARRANISNTDAAEIVFIKDMNTRSLYMKHRGFDICSDIHVFDYIIDTDNLTEDEVFEKCVQYFI